jgi:hypothetical protein
MKVKAKDIYRAEGPWEVLKINIPKYKSALNHPIIPLFSRLTGLLSILKIIFQRLF